MVKQGSQTDRLLSAVAQHLNIGTVAIPVQDQIVYDQHLINIVFPSHTDAEIQGGFIRQRFQLFVGIQSGLGLALCLEILRSAEINLIGSAIHRNIRMDQLIGQMRNPKHGQQPVNDQLVHALMPDDSTRFIKV